MALRPEGAIAQVEPGPAARAFVDAVEPATALIKIQYARRLLDSGETADSWFPESTDVITSTAIKDDRNNALPLEDNGYKRGEWDLVREFEPDYHIPADRSDYADLEDATRYEQVRECMTGTVAMANHVQDAGLDTEIIPFVKGVTRRERWLSYRTIEQLGLDYAAYYANGYFNDGSGVRIDELVEDLETVDRESRELVDSADGPLRLAVLHCLSPQVLERFPACVEAASGLWGGQTRGWRPTIRPTADSEAEMRRIYGDVEARVIDALPRAGGDRARTSTGEAETATERGNP